MIGLFFEPTTSVMLSLTIPASLFCRDLGNCCSEFACCCRFVLCCAVSGPPKRSSASIPLVIIMSGMLVMTVFCSRPLTTCVAIASDGSRSSRNAARLFPPGPNAICDAPKPFGMISATGASPLRTAASADVTSALSTILSAPSARNAPVSRFDRSL